MQTLIAAFALALLGILGVFLVLSLLGVDHAVAGSIATVIIGGVPYIRESLDKHLAARSSTQGVPVLSPGRFGLPAHRVILYGSLMLFAAMEFASGFGGVIAVMLEVENEGLHEAMLATSVLVVFPAAFLVGRWVGRRSAASGLVCILLIALIARIGGTLFDVAIASPEEMTSFLSTMYGEEGSVLSHVFQQIGGGVALFFILGALGYWRGRRQRLGSYLGYLLRNVPKTTQQAIVELAFDEAARASGSGKNGQASNP